MREDDMLDFLDTDHIPKLVRNVLLEFFFANFSLRTSSTICISGSDKRSYLGAISKHEDQCTKEITLGRVVVLIVGSNGK